MVCLLVISHLARPRFNATGMGTPLHSMSLMKDLALVEGLGPVLTMQQPIGGASLAMVTPRSSTVASTA
jgi:hypothetical protein